MRSRDRFANVERNSASPGKGHDALFLALNLQQWGTFDPDSNTVTLHSQLQPGDEDLYDLAAVQTLLSNGVVYAVEPDKMPTGAEIAAIFRY